MWALIEKPVINSPGLRSALKVRAQCCTVTFNRGQFGLDFGVSLQALTETLIKASLSSNASFTARRNQARFLSFSNWRTFSFVQDSSA